MPETFKQSASTFATSNPLKDPTTSLETLRIALRDQLRLSGILTHDVSVSVSEVGGVTQHTFVYNSLGNTGAFDVTSFMMRFLRTWFSDTTDSPAA